ncbi:MAG: polyprenyl synthetase family protein [Chloroflexota bacterium]|nr:polyprenyl synthetase family protein [Chloroflexota bacterium]
MAYSAALTTVGDDLLKVEEALLEVAPQEYPELGAIIAGLVSAGGKRIRPALVLLSARFNSYDLPRLVEGAVAAELLHTATLVHDDTIDRADLRRGKPTVNSFLPDSVAILIGDYIFAQSAMYAAKPGSPEVVSVFASTLRDICDGELRQALGNHRLTFNREEYYRRIYEKTAALFACSTEIGALLSDAPQSHRSALRTYGEKLGQAYQVIDDILDFTATSAQAGKPVGGDLLHGTATLPTIIYLEDLAGANGHATVVLDALTGAEGADPAHALQLVRDSDAVRLAHDEARKLVDEACAALLELPSGEARNALYDLGEYVLERDR